MTFVVSAIKDWLENVEFFSPCITSDLNCSAPPLPRVYMFKPFHINIPFLYPLKHQKIMDFLVFSGDVRRVVIWIELNCCFFCVVYGWPMKGVKPYFQPGLLSEILTIANLRHAASRISTCAEPEFRLCCAAMWGGSWACSAITESKGQINDHLISSSCSLVFWIT